MDHRTDGSTVRLDETDRVLDGYDLLGRIVRNLATEFLFECHHQLDRIEAVRAQIVDEAGIVGDLGFVDAQMLHNDLFYSLGDIAHNLLPRQINALGTGISATYMPRAAHPCWMPLWPGRKRG